MKHWLPFRPCGLRAELARALRPAGIMHRRGCRGDCQSRLTPRTVRRKEWKTGPDGVSSGSAPTFFHAPEISRRDTALLSVEHRAGDLKIRNAFTAGGCCKNVTLRPEIHFRGEKVGEFRQLHFGKPCRSVRKVPKVPPQCCRKPICMASAGFVERARERAFCVPLPRRAVTRRGLLAFCRVGQAQST